MVDFKESLGYLLSITYRHLSAKMGRNLKPLTIGAGQYPYLFALYAKNGRSQQELADIFAVDKTAAKRAIDVLVKEGFVVKKPDPFDKRGYLVYLSGKAEKLLPEIDRIRLKTLASLTVGMSDEEIALAKKLLTKMAENITETGG